MDVLASLPHWALALIFSLLCWFVTALGAAAVFFFKSINRRVLDAMLGFSGGVMIAASFWSLLAPAIDLCAELGYSEWLVPSIGFLCGGGFVLIAGILLDKSLSPDKPKRGILLVGSITLHNIPEGLSIGVAFGALSQGIEGCTLWGAAALAIGIALQNFPEGASVSLPLRREGLSRGKSFFFGQASGIVEPIAAMIGFLLTGMMRTILPASLAFSAGAMIAVVASELLPEGARDHKNLSALGCIVGFAVMMILDVALG